MRNISSLHFSHFERKPGLEYNRNICEGYVRPIFTCQSRDKLKSSTGAKCPIPQGILWCRFQYHETTRSISTSSWKGCKAIIGLFPPCLQHEARRYPNQHSRIGWSLILNMKLCWLRVDTRRCDVTTWPRWPLEHSNKLNMTQVTLNVCEVIDSFKHTLTNAQMRELFCLGSPKT